MANATEIFLIEKDTQEFWMSKKTRVVGIGKYFGYGGKIDDGETDDECVVRETEEECGVKIQESDLIRIAIIDFYKGADVPFGSPTFRVLFYLSYQFEGIPVDGDGMIDPKKFPVDNPPYQEMIAGNELILPYILKEIPIKGWIRFTEDEKSVIDSYIVEHPTNELTI